MIRKLVNRSESAWYAFHRSFKIESSNGFPLFKRDLIRLLNELPFKQARLSNYVIKGTGNVDQAITVRQDQHQCHGL